MTVSLTTGLCDAAAALDVPAPHIDAVIRRGRQRQRRRRFALTTALTLTAMAVAAAGLNLTGRSDRLLTSSPSTPVLAPPPAPSPSPVPPPRPAPAGLADPSPTPNQFPLDIETYNEGVGARLRHRTGGPYLSEADVRDRAIALTRCGDAGTPARCDGVVVRYFESYASAYEGYGPPVWQYMGGFGHDREVYLVTVYGALPFCPKVVMRFSGVGSCPLYQDHFNMVIDATSGEPS